MRLFIDKVGISTYLGRRRELSMYTEVIIIIIK